jgi:uncharacterized lipoprotein YmbA
MSRTGSFLKTCAAGAIVVGLAGCSYIAKQILAPQKDETKFYLLTSAAVAPSAPAAASPSSSADFTLGLGPVKLPPYLDRQEVVTRAAPNRLDLAKTDRWGESLQTNFTSVMSRDLAAQIGTQQIVVFPWYNTIHVDLQVQVEVYRFETDSQGLAQLSAKWTVRDSDGKNILYVAESNLSQQSKAGDTADAAAALSKTVGDLSREIANMVGQLRARSSQHPS